ncbi:MAG TPA: flagellar basal body rod protein FlgB [Planctomycetes bacterium]|nr:flagellar basal body rod protein FlgB [Fuerstiella sp.]HIK94412.1 flagellar basal body rod protein FlgB [Planctomycetota bacterium]
MAIQSNQVDLLTRLLGAAEQRQQVISNNIANVNTPNYRTLELQFEDALAAEITKKGKSIGSPAATSVTHTAGLASRADGNNVDIDKELGLLNKNAMLQQLYLQLIGTDMNQMRRAMEGGP